MERAFLSYTKKVYEYFQNPVNVGEIKNADAVGTAGSVICGDMMKMYMKVKDNRIENLKFLSFGCAANIAAGSAITELAIGQTVEEAEKITMKDVVKKLGGLPKIKVHCGVLAADALREVIKAYKEKRKNAKGIQGSRKS
ncbi:MAG: iron-sulfur cluster assembly scaffold protein [Candidatus Bathyarchaeia archaeon]